MLFSEPTAHTVRSGHESNVIVIHCDAADILLTNGSEQCRSEWLGMDGKRSKTLISMSQCRFRKVTKMSSLLKGLKNSCTPSATCLINYHFKVPDVLNQT